MKEISEYIESGIIEAYVLGIASSDEIREVEDAMKNPEVRKTVDSFSSALEQYVFATALEPDPMIKPLLMATLDFIDRLEKGELPILPPDLNENSTIADFNRWLLRTDFVIPEDFEGVYAKIISHTPEATTAVIWLEYMAPQEVHHKEYEKFLIVEGSCNIIIEDEVHHLTPGDFLAIPLYKNHSLIVTSNTPCKAILQRVAA